MNGRLITGPYHVMLVHFPIALWTTAALIVLLRALSDASLARRAYGALPLLLFLGTLTGALAFVVGNPSAVSEIPRRLGWEVYTTCYLPNWVLGLIVVSAVLLIVIGNAGRRAPA